MPTGEKILEEMLVERPEDPSVNNDLGYLYADQGKNLDRAEGMIRIALKSEPDNVAYLDSMGWVLLKLGRVEEAQTFLEKAAAAPGGADATICEHLGDCYAKMNKPDKAKDAWKKALKDAKDEPYPDAKLIQRLEEKLGQHVGEVRCDEAALRSKAPPFRFDGPADRNRENDGCGLWSLSATCGATRSVQAEDSRRLTRESYGRPFPLGEHRDQEGESGQAEGQTVRQAQPRDHRGGPARRRRPGVESGPAVRHRQGPQGQHAQGQHRAGDQEGLRRQPIESYSEVVYEGYGPGGVAVLCDILTENRNRTAGEIRKIFEVRGGRLGSVGCVAWMFERKGVFLVPARHVDENTLYSAAIDAGADDVKLSGESYEVLCAPESFHKVADALEAAKIPVEVGEIQRVPASTVDLDVGQQPADVEVDRSARGPGRCPKRDGQLQYPRRDHGRGDERNLSVAIEFNCPRCGKLLTTTESAALALAKCPSCSDLITVPATSEPVSVSSGPAHRSAELAGTVAWSNAPTPGPSAPASPYDRIAPVGTPAPTPRPTAATRPVRVVFLFRQACPQRRRSTGPRRRAHRPQPSRRLHRTHMSRLAHMMPRVLAALCRCPPRR